MTSDETQAENDRINARCAELGEAQVRALMSTGGLPHTWTVPVLAWLAKQSSR